MRVLLMQSAPRIHANSGGANANLSIMKELAESGNTVRILWVAADEELKQYEIIASEKQICRDETYVVHRFHMENDIEIVSCQVCNFETILRDSNNHGSLDKHVQLMRWLSGENEQFVEMQRFQDFLLDQINQFKPTHFICNENASLKAVHGLKKISRIFICHAVEHLPFGPYAETPGFLGGKSEAERQRLKEIEGIFCVSKSVQRYIKQYGDIESLHVPLPRSVYGTGPWARFHNFDNKVNREARVLIVNPGYVKGFPIFLQLAQQMPDVDFAAIRSWSMSEHAVQELSLLSNVKLLPGCHEKDALYAGAKVLLVPSLWHEAFGLVCVEAMLRGVPVIAADNGGLVEAKLGVEYCLPVNPIDGSKRHTDPALVDKFGVYIVPEQDATIWRDTLRKLLTDRDENCEISEKSHKAATDFVHSLDPGMYDKMLRKLRVSSEGDNV